MCQWTLPVTIFLIFVRVDFGYSYRFRYQTCSWQFKSNPDDCGTYFQCNHGQSLLRYCGSGLHWNSDFNTCDLASNAGCQRFDEEISSSNILTDETQINVPTDETQINVPTDETQISVLAEEIQIQTDDNSCSRPYMAHPTDCTRYYMCVHGQKLVQQCPAGLHWNTQISNCDWPASAGCTVNGNDTPTTPPSTTTATPTQTTPSTTPITTSTTTSTTPKPTTSTTPTPTTTPTETTMTTTPAPPPSLPSTSGYKVICYFTNWAWYRQSDGKFGPKDIDPKLCTHIVYAFALLDVETWKIRPSDSWLDLESKFYEQVTALRETGTKVTIALGGWNDSADDKYSKLVRDPAKRAIFVNSVSEFIAKHNFDGIDLDWEYPGCPQGDCSKGPDSDKADFGKLIKELRSKMPHAILSAAVSCNKNVIDKGYNVPVMSKYLDWIALMAYDFHGSWEKSTGHISPLYYRPGDYLDYLNSDFAMYHWMSSGAEPEKLILGIPMYGQSFTLANSTNNGLNSPTKGPGTPGEFTRQGGTLAYYEICKAGWESVVEDRKGNIGPYAVSGDQWVSYDNARSILKKIRYIKNEGLGGGMIWALDQDDFRNSCGGGKYPLLTALSRSLRFDISRAKPHKSMSSVTSVSNHRRYL